MMFLRPLSSRWGPTKLTCCLNLSVFVSISLPGLDILQEINVAAANGSCPILSRSDLAAATQHHTMGSLDNTVAFLTFLLSICPECLSSAARLGAGSLANSLINMHIFVGFKCGTPFVSSRSYPK
jgi:hypothetical protein